MPTHDLVADHGGVADGQRATVTAAIASNVLAISGATPFVLGDVGKSISLWSGSYFAATTIAGFTNSSHVTLTSAPDLSSASTDILWGTNNATAFSDYNTWAIAQVGLCTLTIPAGRFCWSSTPFNLAFSGIVQSKVQGAGKTLTFLSHLAQGNMYFGGGVPVAQDAMVGSTGNSARVYTALAGATTIRLKDVTYASKFTVNRWIKITGYDMQGIWNSAYGYPPNPFYYEDCFVTAIVGDTLTVLTPLTNTYKDTWPNWNSGSTGATMEADPGGPATIYAAPASYNTDITLDGFTIDNPHNQSVAHGRSVTMNNVNCAGSGAVCGLYPTQNNSFTATDCDFAGSGIDYEIDKINGTALYTRCAFNILRFQSASVDLFTWVDCTADQVIGTPKRFIATGGTMTRFSPGATLFGRTDEVVLTNVSGIDTFNSVAASHTGIHGGGSSATMTMTAGVIRMANTDNDGAAQENPARVYVPGTWLLLDNKLICQVIDVTQDATYTYIQTDLAGTWPFTVSVTAVHPAPRITVTGCTGAAPELEELNQAPARRPLYSYCKRTYVGGPSSDTPATSRPTLIGRLVTAKYTVSSPYTGASLSFKDGEFNNRPYEKMSDYTTASDFGATINMKLAGLRTISAAAAGSGAQSGDTLMDLSSIGQIWLYGTNNSYPDFSANVSNGETPTISVEFVMDQGIPSAVPAAVVPLRFRLRA
jgi:hypothetical protein